MPTNTRTKLSPIDAALEAAATATEDVTRIQAAILSGDPAVKAGDLEAAESQARLAELRVNAVRTQAAAAEEQERVGKIEKLRDAIEATITDPEPFIHALQAIEDAIIAWHDLNDSRHQQVLQWRRELRELGIGEVRQGTERPEPFGIAPLASDYNRTAIRINNGHIEAIDANRYVTAIAALPVAALRDPSRRPVDLHLQLTRELGRNPK